MKTFVFKDLADSPAYKCHEYLSVIDEWNYLNDLFVGVSSWSKIDSRTNQLIPLNRSQLFLPRHPEELDHEYNHRFQSTDFDDSFSSALRGFVDLMFSDGVSIEAPDYFLNHWKELSDMGIGGDAFLPEVALKTLIFGVSYLWIDYSRDRPYWVLLDPRNIPNYSIINEGGINKLNHVTIYSLRYEYNGTTEEKIEYYRVYKRGGEWIEYQYKENKGDHEFTATASGVLVAKGKPLIDIPLIPVHVSLYKPSLMVGDRLFRSLADKNKALYQITSDYRRKMSLCSTSQPVRYDPMGDHQDIVLSPSRIIDLNSPDAFFRWEEPAVDSLSASRAEKQDLEKIIESQTSKYLANPAPRINVLASAYALQPLEFSIQSFIRSFIDGVNKCIKIHQLYVGDNSDISVRINFKLAEDRPKDSQSVFAIQASYKSGLFTRKSAVKLLEQAGFMDQEILDYELAQSETLPVSTTSQVTNNYEVNNGN